MNCNDFRQRLEQACEAHGPTGVEQAALAEHLETCREEGCRQLWQQMELLAHAVPCWRQDVAEVDLSDGVLARLRREQAVWLAREAAPTLEPRYALVRDPLPTAASPRARGNGLWISFVTSAAALLLVMAVLTLSSPAPREVASSRIVPPQNQSEGGQFPLRDLPTASAAESTGVRLAGTYASMPLSATQFLTDAVVLVVPGDLSDPEEEPSPADAWAERLEKQWEPIGRELNRSLEVLIDAVPRSESAS